jgi:ribosomal protein L37AE/L43A
MATKKECDRCGKQWTPSTFDKDTELATVEIRIPYSHGRHYNDRDQVIKNYELCQSCARTAHKTLETKPTGHGVAGVDPSKYTLRTTSTAAEELKADATKIVQREIMGEPDE